MRKQELHPRTAIINKKQKNESKLARCQALRWLATKFPQAFDNSVSIQPLKHGIMDDILTYAAEAEINGISKSKLREAVVIFTRRIDYLACLKSRETRIDLLGNPVVQVTEEEAERAAEKIRKRVEKSLKNGRNTTIKPFPPFSIKNSEREDFYASSLEEHREATSFTKAAAVVIKHKSARQYDPNAIARLKEKLGIQKKESVE